MVAFINKYYKSKKTLVIAIKENKYFYYEIFEIKEKEIKEIKDDYKREYSEKMHECLNVYKNKFINSFLNERDKLKKVKTKNINSVAYKKL